MRDPERYKGIFIFVVTTIIMTMDMTTSTIMDIPTQTKVTTTIRHFGVMSCWRFP